MFNDEDLIRHLDTKQSIQVESGCFVELNQNDPLNIESLGSFRYGEFPNMLFRQWTGNPELFYPAEKLTTDMRMSMDEDDLIHFGKRPKSDYFNLADCFTEFRPRSGILKCVQPFAKDQVYVDDFLSVRRPRYYIPSVKDQFKYWTSWTTDYIGLSENDRTIKNAAPFAIYKKPVASNMVTVKIQTGNGESTNRRFASGKDPLADVSRSTLPEIWRVEYLDITDTWQTIMGFGQYDPEVLDPAHGNIDFVYMPVNPSPERFYNFLIKGFIDSPALLPYTGQDGDAFVVGRSRTSVGKVVVWADGQWEGASWINAGEGDEPPDLQFQWRIHDYKMNPEEYAINEFTDPSFYNPSATDGGDASNDYNGFVLMKGIRIVVEKMMASRRSFDLIELSPRLFCNFSKNTIEYSVQREMSEDSVLPVGNMSVSNGSVTLSNHDLLLNRETEFDYVTGKGSIVSGKVNRNTKFRFYEIVKGVLTENGYVDKFVPVKTLYATDKPTISYGSDSVQIELRDPTFFLEEKRAQNIVLKDCSVSKAVSTLLDYAGFSNYIFYLGEKTKFVSERSPLDSIIPYFFVNETMSVAEALQAIAIASQCAMFFDEYNNFVVMPREHFNSDPQYVFRGHATSEGRTNIEEIEEIETQLVADVSITFTHRDLARERVLNYRSSGENASTTQGESANTLGYRISPLWDASKLENSVLGVGVLRTSLSAEIPSLDPVSVSSLRNNFFDVGLWAEFFPEFKGHVMMNGEVIRYDAKQYNVGGNKVWVTSQQHLEELIGRSSFRQTNGSGQMIYPTGLMRIFTELATDKQGNTYLVGHGRGIYNSPITNHTAEPTEWVSGRTYLHEDTAIDTVFGSYTTENYNFSEQGNTRVSTNKATATNFIYNPMHSRNSPTELNPINIKPSEVSKFNADRRIMRSSALTFGGASGTQPQQIFKKIKRLSGEGYSLFGARIGIVGDVQESGQSPYGSMTLGQYETADEEGTMASVIGSSGGLLIGGSRLNTNGRQSDEGYYLEVSALNSAYPIEYTEDNKEAFFTNVNFYKINNGVGVGGVTGGNVAVKLWGTYMDIRVTSGSQMARDRLMTDYNVVYDLAVEIKEEKTTSGTVKTFYIYINDMVVGIVEDSNTLKGANGTPVYHPKEYEDTEVGVFVRGSSTIQVEHIYAVGGDKFNSKPIVIDGKKYDRPRSFNIFSPSAMWTEASLGGGPVNNWRYFEEFGSMARECKRVNGVFDLFPALKSKIAPRPIFDRSYSVSHYASDPYSASMIVWAQGDRSIRLTEDMTLDIHGLTLADNQEQTVKIDDFLINAERGAVGEYIGNTQLSLSNKGIQLRNNLLANRSIGQSESIELDSIYIQNRDTADRMFNWLVGFVGVEKTKMTLSMYGIPHIQIGDIISIDYDFPTKIGEKVSAVPYSPDSDEYPVDTTKFKDTGKRFIVRSIQVSRDMEGPDYSVGVVELPDKDIWDAGDF